MSKYLIEPFIALLLVTIIASCDRPICNNTNPIFDQYAPTAREYKAELARQLAMVERSKLNYWMDSYKEDSGSKYITAYLQSDQLCAKIVLLVSGKEKGIEGILSTKGLGYHGAELKGLKFEIKQTNTSTEFVFQEISMVAD